MISVRGLTKSYRDGDGATVEVLRDLSFDVAPGELAVVMGASGSGKSSLLQILGALDTDYLGDVTVDGSRLQTMAEAERARFRNRQVGFIFQSFHLVVGLTAEENVRLPSFFHSGEGAAVDGQARAHELLSQVGLEGKERRTPAQLSGGERQRVAIARALFGKPSLLLCDEPTGNLDAATGEAIVSLLQQLGREQGITILGVTHEPKLRQAASRAWLMEGGRLQLLEGALQ